MTECDAIVGWLRWQAAKGESACEAATGRRQRDLAAGVVAIRNAADAIERLEHREWMEEA